MKPWTKKNAKRMLSKDSHVKTIFANRKSKAKANNIPFDVTYEYVLSIAPDICPVLNIPLSWCESKGKTGNKDNSPTMDKFIPELGYVEGNVYWISHLANRIKSNFNTAQIKAVAIWMESNG